MRRPSRLAVAAVCAAAVIYSAEGAYGAAKKTLGDKIIECIDNAKKLRLGLTAEEVRTFACPPHHINSTVMLTGTREQWVYPDVLDTGRGTQYLYFENGRLVAKQITGR